MNVSIDRIEEGVAVLLLQDDPRDASLSRRHLFLPVAGKEIS